MKIIKTNIDNLLPIKINVSEKNWIKIQENLFSIGCEWSASGKSVLRSYQKNIFVNQNKHITYNNDESYFNKIKHLEIPEYKLL